MEEEDFNCLISYHTVFNCEMKGGSDFPVGFSNFTRLSVTQIPFWIRRWGCGFLSGISAMRNLSYSSLRVYSQPSGEKSREELRTSDLACVAISSFSICSKSQFGEFTLGFLLRIKRRAHMDDT